MAALLQRESAYARTYHDRCHAQGKDNIDTLQYTIKFLQPDTWHAQNEDKRDTPQYTLEFLRPDRCDIQAKNKRDSAVHNGILADWKVTHFGQRQKSKSGNNLELL